MSRPAIPRWPCLWATTSIAGAGNPRRSRAITKALKREGHQAAKPSALARQAKQQAHKRSASERSQIARKASRTRLAHQTHAERVAIARKGARTRARHGH